MRGCHPTSFRSSLLVLVATVTACAAAQAPPAFDSSRAYTHVREQVALGPRPAGSAANQKTRDYIRRVLKEAGYASTEQAFEATTPVGRVRMANVIATLPGRRPERLILASHFDTKPFDDIRFVGANDGASSTGVLLELARVLKAGPTPPLTIEFLFFDGEEAFGEWQAPNHTYGSRHYVAAARSAGTLTSIRALVLLDMVGDRNLNLRRDTNSTPWLTDLFWATARRLGHGAHFLKRAAPGRGRPHGVSRRRHPGGRSDRPRLPRVAHRRRHARQGLGAQPAGRR